MVKGLVSNYAEQIRGVSYKPNDLHNGLDNDSVILLRANNIDDGRINFEDVVYVDRKKVSDFQYLRKGDVLICASSGSKNLVGKAASVDFDIECTFGAFCKVVRPTKVAPEFLGLFFQSPNYRKKISELAQGANINNIKNEHIDNLQLEIYSESEQRLIVECLSRTIAVINARKEELSKLDELIKARFVEMSSRWNCDEKLLSEYLEMITYGFTNPMPDAEDGPWKITAKDVVDGRVNFSKARKTTQESFDSLTDKSKPITGDVLLTKDGTLGRTAVVEDDNICVNQSVAVLRCNRKVIPQFLSMLLQLPEYQREMTKNSGGGTIKHIYITRVNKMVVKIPTIEQQNEFIRFWAQVDKSKVAIQKSLDETQLLFDSLMQKYFG